MTEFVSVVTATSAGLALGLLFYGGLWWTVLRSVCSETTSIWPIASFLSRTTLAVAGFYAVSQSDWRRWLTCLCGFLIARGVVTWLTRRLVVHP